MERALKHKGEKPRASATAAAAAAGPSAFALHQSVGNQALQRAHGAPAGARVWEGRGADRMLRSLGALGAALGPDVLVSRNLDWRTRKAVLAHELTHARQTGGRAPSGGVGAVGARGSREEREARIAGAIGVPLGGSAAAADPGVLRLYDPVELLYGSITDAWAQALDDDELVEAGAGLRDEMERLAPETPEYAGAFANNAIIERELVARGLDAERREALAEAIAADPVAIPVAFGVDSETDEVYVTVTPPGANLVDVAAYLYGAPALAGELGELNGFGATDMLTPGTTLKMLPDERSRASERALEAGFETGAIIRTEGIPDALQDSGEIYYFDGPDGLMMLNRGQLNALLQGIRYRTLRLLQLNLDVLRVMLHTRDHQEEESLVMRNLIEWWGDVDIPDREPYVNWIATGEATLAEVEELVFEEDPRDTARTLLALQRRGCDVAEAEEEISNRHFAYLYGFISGGEDLVGKLEFARNVSLGIVAGIAGALVAPAAFAALTAYGVGTAAATGLSIGAAGLAGGTARGTLQAAPYAILGHDDAGDRFASGFYSGTIEGATGGAGSFLTPLVTGAVSTRLAATGWGGRGFVQTARGQYAVQGVTGAIIGAPSGGAGAALENLPDLVRGKMSGEDYFWGVGQGTVLGGGFGGGFGAASTKLPITGLYRTGGFRGDPVTPRWMLAGPYSPISDIRGVTPGFHALPEDALPPLGHDTDLQGYSWARLRSGGVDEWVPVRSWGPERELELAWYADPADPRGNYNLLYGPEDNPNALRLIGSRGTQRPDADRYQGLEEGDPEAGMPSSGRSDFPMEREDFWVTMPDGSIRRMVRGHNVDYADTTNRTSVIPDSNLDPRNFTPEPSEWGRLSGRQQLTARMRREAPGGGTQYRQVNVYGENPMLTAGGKPVPDHIYFIEVGPTGATRAWRIPFNDPDALGGGVLSNVANIDLNFGIDMTTLPVAVPIDPNLLPPSVVAAAWPRTEEEEPPPPLR